MEDAFQANRMVPNQPAPAPTHPFSEAAMDWALEDLLSGLQVKQLQGIIQEAVNLSNWHL